MKTLEIVDTQKQAIAEVAWEAPDHLTVKFFDSSSEKELNAIIERAKQTGIPYRVGGQVKDSNLMIDEQQAIGPNNENFLEALSNIIGQLKFGGKRVFGLMKQK